MGVEYRWLEQQADEMQVEPAIERAYAMSHPICLLIGSSPSTEP
jgi:hypothetical protein